MKSLDAETLINARNSTVWDIITDAGNYTVWDSGITNIQGELRDGGTIRIRTRTRGNRTLRLRVQQIAGEVMTWTGGIPLRLYKGVRTFTLSPQSGMTHLRVKEEFSGPLLGLKGKTMADTEQSLTDYVNAVKERAELLG